MIILLTAGRARHKRLLKVKAPRKWAFSSVGRASPLQGEGQKFESSNAHHLKKESLKTLFLFIILKTGKFIFPVFYLDLQINR